MNITIIETGLPNALIRDQHDDYPTMFARLVGGADAELTFSTVSPAKGETLPDPTELDAILITGASVGVYDPEPWMPGLMDFIRGAAAAKIPQVGICFGHQAIAQAMGGEVAKSGKGWGVGRHAYELTQTPNWMGEDAPQSFAIMASHQDQVLQRPAGSQVIARSDFTPNAALEYTAAPIISFQGHPEIENAFAHAMIGARLGNPITIDEVEAAQATLETPHDNPLVGQWLARFYRTHSLEPVPCAP